jgi:hydrogenase expression/formation protein HypE
MAIDIQGSFSCPLPKMNYKTVQLAHGAGGRLSAELIDKIFLPCFANETLDRLEDQATLNIDGNRLAFTTDSFVVNPVFFPGGNIGELAVNGTVNDVCMSGAEPLYLSVGFIIEEGLEIEKLHNIAIAMKNAADIAGVQIVTGDTKVVNRGACDKLFINTSGIGVIRDNLNLSAANLKVGDKIILSGTIADHGMAVMTVREGLSFRSEIQSDTASLNHLVSDMLSISKGIRAMRDPTRGGVATTLNELAQSSKVGIHIVQKEIPLRDDVNSACEILGIDPLYVANEGKLIAIVPAEDADAILEKMKQNEKGKDAAIIGEVTAEHAGMVVMENELGVDRVIDVPLGEQLPRIC